MTPIQITFALIGVALALFVWGKVPPVIVAIGVSLALYFTGVLPVNQALGGFGDLTVVLIASLFVIAAGLDVSGVTTWVGQLLTKRAGQSRSRLMLMLMALAAIFCATISVNATVAALLPLCVVLAMRTGMPTSKLLLPMVFATHGAVMMTLIGAPLNVLASDAAADAGYGPIGFFEFAIAGTPLLIGTVLIIMITYRRFLPDRYGSVLPADFSSHAKTLVEQYRIEDGVHRLRVRHSSPLIGAASDELGIDDYTGVSVIAVQDEAGTPVSGRKLHEGDILVASGDAETAGRLAEDKHLAFRSDSEAGDLADTLFNRRVGLAEVVIPPRSGLIGETAFIGMAQSEGDLVVLGIQRAGQDVKEGPHILAAGDHLVLQGTWKALDKHLDDPQVLVVDSPELVRRQAVPLGLGAKEALGILLLLVVLLATGLVPSAIAGLICASLMVLLGVITVPQAYRGIDWNTCFLVGGMIPLGVAMTQTGAAELIGHTLVNILGDLGPRAVLAGLFLAALAITSVISNTATALLFFPIGIATAHEIGVSPMPFIISLAIASHAALLTPVATPVNLMVMGPGGYKFTDYTKFGIPITIWWMVVALFLVPLYWNF